MEFYKDTTKFALDWIAITLSVVAIAWTVGKDLLRDSVGLSISVRIGTFVSGSQGLFFPFKSRTDMNRSHPIIAVAVTNTGRRDIVIARIGLVYKRQAPNKREAMLEQKEPYKLLEPYGRYVEFTDDLKIINALRSDDIREIYVQDTKEKKWRLPKHSLEALVNDTVTFVPGGSAA